MISFADTVRAAYNINAPFFDGTFEAARRHADDEVAYLVIYLHCPTHEYTRQFAKSVLGDDEVIEHLTEKNAVLFGASVAEWAGWRLAQELQVTTFPSVVVVFRKTLVLRLQGHFTKSQFLHEWAACTDMWDGELAQELSGRLERTFRQHARNAEEAALSEMELADIARLADVDRELEERREAARLAAAEQTRREAEAAAAAAEEREAMERAARESARRSAEELEQRKMAARLAQEAATRLPPEPPADAAATTAAHDVASVSLRTLQGKQHQRRFYRSALVDALLDFAVAMEGEGYDGGALKLVTGFPPKALQWVPGLTRIADVTDLCPRAVVIVRRA